MKGKGTPRKTWPEYVPELDGYVLALPNGAVAHGSTSDGCLKNYQEALHHVMTCCPSCGFKTDKRVCPECSADREWYASEVEVVEQDQSLVHGTF